MGILIVTFLLGYAAHELVATRSRRAHRPRAALLRLPDPGAHRCEYAREKKLGLMCKTCRRPPPTPMPGPGMPRLG